MKKLRKSIKYILPLLAAILVLGLLLSRIYRPGKSLNPESTIDASEASKFIGHVMEVCGIVASSDYLENIEGKPTFLNLGSPYPHQYFTAVIWGQNVSKWQYKPHVYYSGRYICVTGKIELHEDTPQITIRNPGQITIREYSPMITPSDIDTRKHLSSWIDKAQGSHKSIRIFAGD